MLAVRHTTMKMLYLGIAGLAIAASMAAGMGLAADYEPGTPSTWLFDTGTTSSVAIPATGLDPAPGWTLVREDVTTHKFRGDALVRNDRLVVVLRAKGAGAEIYGQSSAGAKLRAVLAPVAHSGSSAAALADVRIVENGPAAVMLGTTFTAADGKTCSMTCRLTAGQVMMEVRPGEGTGRVLVNGESRYLVVPDFFGDDMVFRADDVSHARLRLPAENFFLQMVDGGSALVMCVWQSGTQGAVAIRGPEGQRAMTGCEIDAVKDKSVWVACLEGAGLWHDRRMAGADASREMTLDWKPPLPAKWRTDLLRADGTASSWYFRSQEDAGEAHQAISPCCLEAGRAVVRLPLDPPGGRLPGTLLVYAMDRNRDTPLTAFCPIDVLRNTLGVGPCQYILQTEGFAVETSPTPDSAMSWVEKQFRRKKQKKAADEIRELLDQMVRHIDHAQARIQQYGRLGSDMRALCTSAPESPSAKALGQTAARLEQTALLATSKPTSAERAARIAAEVAELTGKPSALAACERLGAEARAIGAVQDRTLANCRMMVRWLKQSAAMFAEEERLAGPLAEEVQVRAAQMLQPQGPNTSPKH